MAPVQYQNFALSNWQQTPDNTKYVHYEIIIIIFT